MLLISSANEDQVIEDAINSYGVETCRMNLTDMPYGDYMWQDISGLSIGVERKAVGDFRNSLHSGRLETQLAGCLDTYDKTMVLIEYEKKWRGRVLIEDYDSFPGAVFRLQALGVDVLWSFSREDTGRVIAKVYKNSLKKNHTMMKRYVRKRPVLLRPDKNVETLLAVSMVGGCRMSAGSAAKIIMKYGTPWSALENVDDWRYVEGVGPKIVSGMKEVLGKYE